MARPLRYTFILILVALSTCLAAVGGWRYARASAPVNGPIVLISIDSLRADHLTAYGYTGANTPAIDSLAADGVVFERAYSHVPQTLPAHASLLSGRLPFETGVRDGIDAAIPPAERLLAEMLRDRGFATGGVVSSALLGADSGINQGFEFFDDEMPATTDRIGNLHRPGVESVEVAERWLESIGTSRAFLFLQIDEPRLTRTGLDETSDGAAYDAAVVDADGTVARLVKHLKAHQLYDQSTVILLSDHGAGLGQHGEQQHGLFVYDDTLRIPFIIKPAAGEGAGRRVASPVQHLDLVPTILDLAKAPVPGNLRGRSLTRLLDGSGGIDETPIYSESLFARTHFGWGELRSVVSQGYRYISAPREELYDLAADPEERVNLAEAKPDVAARLKRMLASFGEESARSALLPPPSRDPVVAERAEAMGYVGRPSVFFAGPRPSIDPKDKGAIVELYRGAVRQAFARDGHAAIEAFRELVQQEPGMTDAWMRLAAAASRQERHDLAVAAYKHVAQSEPLNFEAHLGLSAALLKLKKVDEARLHAQRVVADEAARGEIRSAAHEILARVALSRRNADAARAEASLAETADPTRPVTAYVEGRLAFDALDYQAALTHFEPALAQLEKGEGTVPADLRLYTAEALLQVERFSEAEYLFRLELSESPFQPRARADLATLYTAMGRSDEAAAIAGH